MIKIFDTEDKVFNTNGIININELKCEENKSKSLNGWYIDVEVPIEFNDYIISSYLCVIQTKSKAMPQAFRIGSEDTIIRTNSKVIFKADHVAIADSKDYFLLDVRPTNLAGLEALNYINERTDKISPFTIFSDVETLSTAYFIRKNLFEAWEVVEDRWGGVFDFDNWNVYFKYSVGTDQGKTITYGHNLKAINIIEDWSNVVTRLYPVGYNGLLLPEKFIDSDIEYKKPYTKEVSFSTDLDYEEQTEEKLITELRYKAEQYLENNKYPLFSYEVVADIDENLEIGDKIHVKHPLVDLTVEVVSYQHSKTLNKTKKMVFGNYIKNVRQKFNEIKNQVIDMSQKVSSQQELLKNQTNIINTLNKNGYVYIDDNEVLILNKLPKEEATKVIRLGLGGIGFGDSYSGTFDNAWTIDGVLNADFIKSGTLDGSLIKANSITADKISTEVLKLGGNNIIKNSARYFNSNWTNIFPGITNTEIKNNTVSKSCFLIGNGEMKQQIQVQNGTYTVSFKYKKLLGLATIKIIINDHELLLDSTDWKIETYTFEVLSNTIEISVIGNNDSSCYLSDLMGNVGIIAQVWSSAPGESVNGGVLIGETIEITSPASNIKHVMDHDGDRIINTNIEEVVAEYTDKGLKADEIESKKGQIAKLLINDAGNQTWMSRM